MSACILLCAKGGLWQDGALGSLTREPAADPDDPPYQVAAQ